MDPLGGNSSANGEDTQLPDRFETDIPAMEKENELQVFPNPTNDLFTVIFPRAAGECFLSDINGIIVYNEKIGKETKTSYFRLAKGVYFLKWIEGTEIITKKIIVL
jgi:hypothetical protein